MQAKNINIHIGNRLRLRRITLGFTQGAIAKAMKMTAQQVQKYEKGVNSMNAERMHEFAEFLKVPVAYFFEGFGQRSAGKSKSSANKKNDDSIENASDRESIELLKSFKQIKDSVLRKRVADLLRSISLKDF